MWYALILDDIGKAIDPIFPHERVFSPFRRQMLYAGKRIAAIFGAIQNRLMDIGSQEVELHTGQ